MTRAIGSPKTPHTVGSGRKPGKQYASHSRRLRFDRPAIQLGCQIADPAVIQNRQEMHSFLRPSDPKFAHSIPRRPIILLAEQVVKATPPSKKLTQASRGFRNIAHTWRSISRHSLPVSARGLPYAGHCYHGRIITLRDTFSALRQAATCRTSVGMASTSPASVAGRLGDMTRIDAAPSHQR